jgi:hypothetical protein
MTSSSIFICNGSFELDPVFSYQRFVAANSLTVGIAGFFAIYAILLAPLALIAGWLRGDNELRHLFVEAAFVDRGCLVGSTNHWGCMATSTPVYDGYRDESYGAFAGFVISKRSSDVLMGRRV